MGGSNQYCMICGGPTCSSYLTVDDDAWGCLSKLSGIIHDDMHWIEKTSVVVYADCLSPPGEYNWSTYCVDVESLEARDINGYIVPEDGKHFEDPVRRPEAAISPLGCGEYSCEVDGRSIAHELCTRLAACWAQEAHPEAFSGRRRADPARFFWTILGPTHLWACQSDVSSDNEVTKVFLARSEALMEAAGSHPRISHNWLHPTFHYGYDEKDSFRGWLSGCGQDYEFKEQFGITHLKRPDHFPPIHELPPVLPVISESQSMFPVDCPLDVGLIIISQLDDPSLRVLECTSRAWRNFLRAPLVQRVLWFPLLRECHFTPTDADWTDSAEAVRQAIASPERKAAVDWRRYYDDCRKSLNMSNRRRIYRSVRVIGEWLGHFERHRTTTFLRVVKGEIVGTVETSWDLLPSVYRATCHAASWRG